MNYRTFQVKGWLNGLLAMDTFSVENKFIAEQLAYTKGYRNLTIKEVFRA